MELSGAMLQRAPMGGFAAAIGRRPGVAPRRTAVGRFADEGHVGYYGVRCEGRTKEEKRRAKLVKGLEKDLSEFYNMGFGRVGVQEGVAGEVKGKMISEAAELLLAQLKQLKAEEKEEEKEMKRKRKEEKAAMKAAKMKDCDESSSSSSSESSDDECETVVRMGNLKTKAPIELRPESPTVVVEVPEFVPGASTLEPKTGCRTEENQIAQKLGEECSIIGATHECCNNSTVVSEKPLDKIEVCMGGKCKKSGALDLIEEFEKRVGTEGAVVGCKCMGKCRDGPNVRVLNHVNGEDSVQELRNPLCIGVGLEDVGAIVANFFGEKKDVGLLPA